MLPNNQIFSALFISCGLVLNLQFVFRRLRQRTSSSSLNVYLLSLSIPTRPELSLRQPLV